MAPDRIYDPLVNSMVRSLKMDYFLDWSEGSFFHDFHDGLYIPDLYQSSFFRGDLEADEPKYRTGAALCPPGVRIERAKETLAIVPRERESKK